MTASLIRSRWRWIRNRTTGDKFIWKLAGRLHKAHQDLKEAGADKHVLADSKSELTLCHAMGLSGMPAKEEMFSAPICGTASERAGRMDSLDAVNPLVVESLRRKTHRHRDVQDVIVALNNGMVHRLHGSTGRRLWAVAGAHHVNFPTWEEGGNHNALLTRLQSRLVPPPIRPILLAGENGMAVLSVKTGEILASTAFPEKATVRPILADVSGDGSTDLLTISKEGIWGYRIVVHRGNPITLRIAVGLLLMALMLALLRNRYKHGDKDKRSTDA